MASTTLSKGSPITVHPVGALAFSGTVQLATDTMIIVSESPSIISILRHNPNSREPFGDYSNVYRPMGKGTGLESLKTFLAQRVKETK